MKKNAISMAGDIDRCWLFAYRVPASHLAQRVPKQLEIVTQDQYGFINVVISELSHMRPFGLPAMVGLHYWHVAYRTYVRFTPPGSEAIEGLYFLRSDADNAAMVALGNLFTDFQFHLAKIGVEESLSRVALTVGSDDAPAVARLDHSKFPTLAAGSPFADLTEAQTFLKYKPCGISVSGGEVDVLRISRDESAWKSKLVHVDEAEFEFLRPFSATLEVCYEVEPVHYIWNRAERYKT